MGHLDGQIAIITGAGTGIGREAALMFADEGAKLVITGRRIEPLNEVVGLIESAGGSAVAKSVDMEDGDAAAALGEWALNEYGQVDILVNNAGHSSKIRSIQYVGAEEWNSVFKVNVEGVYRLTQSVVGSMIERGAGTVITTSSMAALRPGLLGGAAYSAAKAASYNLMRGINAELNAKGIRACTVLPAEVDTPILNNRPHNPDAAARATMMMPEDVAAAILLCATLPGRTVIEEIVMSPTQPRDRSIDMAVAAKAGSPDE
ncbi:MAG: SDR family NAD(P)-dependent oxidoreductase [Dehalococcoidia bacterium]|jgi:NADP-dependent 3-hydroxy acid dehydrogenase YdfG|nr:3-oxoacyl-ACP reductase [Chloroflexota bacterium]MDP6056228.1 SDR family NAD(P)-dependent oxidoreductase [Dehalococcoidia bacterium]MDP7090054.1 SDR family NAD(P)-dependent oxidoreductase [Dehalococcoidia bacterium]MDP7261502.1 SDR family NAD(P)-dependent oxidoreductase [Dehalococcoidia bacterium]MDP7485171.1 SDR family NAD(P)-dependent oxidoreductase [Dehalococcoidia bacterium]